MYMINDIHSKFNQFSDCLIQPNGVEKNKLESLTNELVDEILKSNDLDLGKDLSSLAKNVEKVSDNCSSDRIKIMLLAERVFKACEQRGIDHPFSSILGKSIKNLEARLRKENLLDEIDDKRLGFIHGDTFLSASGLEGGKSINNVKFLLPYIKEGGLFNEKKEVLEMLEEYVKREEAMRPLFSPGNKNSFENYQKQSNDYSEFLCNKIKTMQEGERFLMSGGWSNIGAGHAMFYIVEKGKNGKYAFTVLNTGEGIQNHQAQEIELKTKYKPILRLHDIDESSMANQNFFMALFELNITLNPKDGKTSWDHSANDIYDRIIPALQGKRDLEFEDRVDFVTDQRSGTCSWMSIMKFLHSEATETKAYKAFNFALRRDSLNVYFNKLYKSNLPLNGMRIELLKRCTENFAQNSLKQHKKGVVSNDELKNAKNLVEDIQKQIKIWESASPIKSMEIDLEKTAALQGTVLNKELFAEHEVNPSIISQENLSLALSIDHLLEKMPDTLDQFQNKLEKLIDTCKNLRIQEEYRISNDIILQFVTSIDSFEKSIDTWTEGVEQEKIEKTMDSILRI